MLLHDRDEAVYKPGVHFMRKASGLTNFWQPVTLQRYIFYIVLILGLTVSGACASISQWELGQQYDAMCCKGLWGERCTHLIFA